MNLNSCMCKTEEQKAEGVHTQSHNKADRPRMPTGRKAVQNEEGATKEKKRPRGQRHFPLAQLI